MTKQQSGPVDVFNPLPPDWYVPLPDLETAIDLVRNGNAVFWKVTETRPDGTTYPEWGIFLPGTNVTPGNTPAHAELLGPPDGRPGLTLPGVPQHVRGTPGYPVVTEGVVIEDPNNTTGYQLVISPHP